MVDVAVDSSRNAHILEGIMTVTFMHRDQVGTKMSLFQDLKLKRHKVDSRCSSDGDGIVENCSPDSGLSSSSPRLTIPFSTLDIQSTSPRLTSHIEDRTSPDSAGDEFTEVRCSYDSRHGGNEPDPRIFDGGGDEFVSSTPMPMRSRSRMDQHEEMSITPPPEMNDRKVGIQSTIHIAPLFAGADEGCSLGAGGTGGGLVDSLGMSNINFQRPQLSSSTSPIWSGRYNGSIDLSRTVSVQPPCKDNLKNPQSQSRVPRVVMMEQDGVRTMTWEFNDDSCHQSPYNNPPREFLSSSGSTHTHFGVDTSDAVRASIDGLLSLGQDRRVPSPQQCTSPSMPLSRSPHNHAPRSPYSVVAPSSPYGSMMRVTSSLELQHRSPTSCSSYSSFSNHSSDSSRGQSAPLNMESLWAVERAQYPHQQPDSQAALNLSKVCQWSDSLQQSHGSVDSSGVPMTMEDEEEDQPMICMICEDRATGLHYGIITCEGCKGFFKRTVQNKRIYTCVADGNCEITKTQRNRCQFCRFNKCLSQGMVLAAVREDRMPGGRNSGAVYNMYKVKYKKKKNKNGQIRQGPISPDKSKMVCYEQMATSGGNSMGANPPNSSSPTPMNTTMTVPIPTSYKSPYPGIIAPGKILQTALTNPGEVAHLTCRPDNRVSSTRENHYTFSPAYSMINALLECDDFEDFSSVKSMEVLCDRNIEFTNKLCDLGDGIALKLVAWTKKLPFYKELPISVHTHLLTSKWHDLLVLASSTYQAIYHQNKYSSRSTEGSEAEFKQEMANNFCNIERTLANVMGEPYSMHSLKDSLEELLEHLTVVTIALRKLKIQMEEYVCLKVIILLHEAKTKHRELELIQDRYIHCLQSFCEAHFPSQPNRVQDLLVKISDIHVAAGSLVKTKMFYVPFLMCFSSSRR